jgi:hypothetical protein
MKVRENGRVVNVAVMVATGINADGYREILPRKRGHPQASTRPPANRTPHGCPSSAT